MLHAPYFRKAVPLLPWLWWKLLRYETEQEARYVILFFFLSLLLFFLLRLCSGVDNIRMWPLWDKVHEPHGSVGNILNAALKRNTSQECQTLSISDKRFLFPFFHRISLFWCLRQIWPYARRIQCAVTCVRPDCHFSLFYLVIKADEWSFLFDNKKSGYRLFCIIFLCPSDKAAWWALVVSAVA